MNHLIKLIIAMALSFHLNSVAADLAQVTLSVKGTSEAQRKQSLPKALAQVLQRLSPDLEGDTLNSLVASLDSEAYVQSYSHSYDAAQQPLLDVVFNKSALVQKLQQLQFSVWEQERPILGLWLLDLEKSTILTQADLPEHTLGRELMTLLAQNGFEVQIPSAILQQQSGVSLIDIIAANKVKLSRAMLLDDSAVIIVGLMSSTGDGRKMVDWKLLDGAKPIVVSKRSIDALKLAQYSGQALLAELREKYSMQSQEVKNTLRINIENIRDFTAHQQVSKILHSLIHTHGGKLNSLSGTKMSLTLDNVTSSRKLVEVLSRNEHIVPQGQPLFEQLALNHELNLRYVK